MPKHSNYCVHKRTQHMIKQLLLLWEPCSNLCNPVYASIVKGQERAALDLQLLG